MESLVLSGLGAKNKLSFDFSAIGSSMFLNLNGSGWGASTVDAGNELILLFSNDSTVTLRSPSLQSFESGEVANKYSHRYVLTTSDLLALSNYVLTGLRKYSFNSFADLRVARENGERLRKLSLRFASELKKVDSYKRIKQIALQDIRNYIGDSVIFCSKVYKTRYFQGSEESPTLLDVQANLSDPFVNVLILEKDRPKFSNAPEMRYANKKVCIFGLVQMRNNIPTIIIRNETQIKLLNPLSAADVEHFEGDSIAVAGKIFTTRYLKQGAEKTIFMNMSSGDPAHLLTLVVENNDRRNFSEPEEDYLNKTVTVWGKPELVQGVAQIKLHNKNQIEVTPDQKTEVAVVTVQNTKAQMEKRTEAVPIGSERAVMKIKSETAAEFPGGRKALLNFLTKNLNSPFDTKSKKQKTVVASFLINEQGSCNDVQIVESAGYVFDEAVKGALLKMPKWKPATLNGNKKSTRITLPINFSGTESEMTRSN